MAARAHLWFVAISLAAMPATLSAEAKSSRPDPSDAGCATPTGWAEIAARRAKYSIFGEMHGTRESPAFVGSIACGLASGGKRLLIAVELDATANSSIQNAWSLSDEQFDEVLRASGWFRRADGVGSEAMFKLIGELHRLKLQGRSIDIVAFNGFRDEAQRQRFISLPGQGPHEAAQAENIRRAAESQPYDHVLVLVGNLHARKVPVERGAVRYKPMAMQLGSAAEVTTLNMRSSGGSMWNCLTKPNVTLEPGKPIPPGAIDCGNHQTGLSSVDLGPEAFVKLGPFPGEPAETGYDGFYWLGRVNGSPPAILKP